MKDMVLNTLFKVPILVRVEAVWHEHTFEEAKAGKEDYIIQPEWEGKCVGVVNLHAAGIPHYIVVSPQGQFYIKEQHEITALDYESI